MQDFIPFVRYPAFFFGIICIILGVRSLIKASQATTKAKILEQHYDGLKKHLDRLSDEWKDP